MRNDIMARMAKAKAKNNWMFEQSVFNENTLEVLNILAKIQEKCDDDTFNQFNTTYEENRILRGLNANGIENIGIAECYDLSHTTILYPDNTFEQVAELIEYGYLL
jgi:hypothetical protein